MNAELAWGVSSEIFEGNKKRRIKRRFFKPGSEPVFWQLPKIGL
jgi:hypothetical protein